METPRQPNTRRQDAYNTEVARLVDRGVKSYDDARRFLAGTALEQAAAEEARRDETDMPIEGSPMTVGQAADILQWYYDGLNTDAHERGHKAKVGLGNAAYRITSDRPSNLVEGLDTPLLTRQEAVAAMNNILTNKH